MTSTSSLLDYFKCPLSHVWMEDPVTDPCGHVFHGPQIVGWLRNHAYCPFSLTTPLTPEQLVTNEVFKDALRYMRANGERGGDAEERETIALALKSLRTHPRLPASEATRIRTQTAFHDCKEKVIDAAGDCAAKTLAAAADCGAATLDTTGTCAQSSIAGIGACAQKGIRALGTATDVVRAGVEKFC